MPLSMYVANLVKGLDLNLIAFGEADWEFETRTRLIDESVAVLDEILLDPVFNLTLRLAYEARAGIRREAKRMGPRKELLLDFLEKEKRLLKGTGLDDGRVERVLAETKRILVAGLQGLAPPSEVFGALVRVKFTLLSVRDHHEEPGWPAAAASLALGLAGLALVGLNASGIAVSLGLTGALSAMSSAVGGVVFQDGAKGVVQALKAPIGGDVSRGDAARRTRKRRTP